ncbi:MAG: hypothetical protein ACR2H0_06065 [Candidatus Limnocylindrales bacterium]
MVRGSRVAYVVLAWTFVAGMVVQVFLIGLGLLGRQPSGTTLHRDFGWLLHLIPLLVLLFAALSRAGKRHWQWALALAVVVLLIPIFVTLRDTMPVLAALHPVAAVLAFPISLVVALNSLKALRERAPTQRPLTG